VLEVVGCWVFACIVSCTCLYGGVPRAARALVYGTCSTCYYVSSAANSNSDYLIVLHNFQTCKTQTMMSTNKRKSPDDVFASLATGGVLPKKTTRFSDVFKLPGLMKEHLCHYFTEWEVFAMTLVTHNKEIGATFKKSDPGLSVLSHWFHANQICCVCHAPVNYSWEVNTTEVGMYCHKKCLPSSSIAYFDGPGEKKAIGLWRIPDTNVKIQAGVPLVYLYDTYNPCVINPRATKQGYNRAKYPATYMALDKACVDLEIKRTRDFIHQTINVREFLRVCNIRGRQIMIGNFSFGRYDFFASAYPDHVTWKVTQMIEKYDALEDAIFLIHDVATCHFRYITRPAIRNFVRPVLYRTWSSFLRHTVLQGNMSFFDLLIDNRCHEDPRRLCHVLDAIVATYPEIVAARENHLAL
jgi:hypothetical protein